jgi:hypothetical protein
MNRLVRCVNCDEVFFKTPFDQAPEYEQAPCESPEALKTVERDDFEGFLAHHRGHRLEDLRIIEDSFVSEKPYWEPVKVSYFRATNGKEKFVIRKFRERIDEPLKYELVSGDYSLTCTALEMDWEDLLKQMRTELSEIPLLEEKIAAFLKLCKQITSTLKLETLERVAEDSAHPLEIAYRLDDVSLMYLLRNARHIFKETYPEVEAFIHRHKDDGVLLVKGRFRIELSEKAVGKAKEVPSPALLKKALEKKREI